MLFEGAQIDRHKVVAVCPGYDPFSIPDKANAVISLVSIRSAGHLQHTVSKRRSGPPSIEVALQPLCYKLVDEALVATMRGLARIFIVCTEPATELVLALVNVDW